MRRENWVTLSSWGARGVTSIVSLVNLRLLNTALETQGFAVYALCSNLLAWCLLFDFGLGNTLQNKISEIRAQTGISTKERSTQVASWIFAVLKGAILMLLCFIILSGILSVWLGPYYLGRQRSEGQSFLFFLTITLFGVHAVGTIVQKIWYAQHKGYLGHIASVVTVCISLSLNLFAQRYQFHDPVFVYILTMFLPQACLGLGTSFYFIHRTRKSPRISVWSTLWREAKQMSVMSFVITASLYMDAFVMARLLLPEAIVVYSLVTRCFDFVRMLFSSVLLAHRPSWTEAYRRAEISALIYRLKKFSVKSVLGIGLISISLAVFMEPILGVLAPKAELSIPFSFLVAVVALEMLRSYTNTLTTFMLSAEGVSALTRIFSIQAIITVVLQIILTRIFGITGITIGFIVGYTCTAYLAKVWVDSRDERLALHSPTANTKNTSIA